MIIDTPHIVVRTDQGPPQYVAYIARDESGWTECRDHARLFPNEASAQYAAGCLRAVPAGSTVTVEPAV